METAETCCGGSNFRTRCSRLARRGLFEEHRVLAVGAGSLCQPRPGRVSKRPGYRRAARERSRTRSVGHRGAKWAEPSKKLRSSMSPAHGAEQEAPVTDEPRARSRARSFCHRRAARMEWSENLRLPGRGMGEIDQASPIIEERQGWSSEATFSSRGTQGSSRREPVLLATCGADDHRQDGSLRMRHGCSEMSAASCTRLRASMSRRDSSRCGGQEVGEGPATVVPSN
jgi:hypothetical protein